MSATITVPDGNLIDPDNLPLTLFYNGDGTLNYIQVQVMACNASYRQTFSYTEGRVSGITQWVKQP